MRKIATEATNKFFGQLWDDLIGYFKVYDFIKLKAQNVVGNTVLVPSAESFWYSILGDKFAGKKNTKYIRLKHGDVVKLKDLFITEWAPKLPGRIWTESGLQDYEEGLKHIDNNLQFNRKVYTVLSPYGKERVVSAGYGSIRINRRRHDTSNYMYMSLVSDSQWHCDYGLPVVVSKSVYNEYIKLSKHGTPWVQKLEGVLHIHDDLPFNELVPKAIGAKLSPEVESTLRYRPGLPKCYIKLTSPLTIKLRTNDSNPNATAWTIFRTKLREQPFRFTYAIFNPGSEISTNEAIEFINWYVKEYKGTKIVTDFDGLVPRLDATIPLNVHPIKSRKKDVTKLVSDCNKWAKYRLAGGIDY